MKRILLFFLLIFSLFVASCSGVSSQADDVSSENASTEKSSSINNVSSAESATKQPEADGYVGFISVDGQRLVDENGKEYFIKGMAFGNNVFAYPRRPPLTDHNKDSFSFLSELGFNSVRFYLNYNLFEDDNVPYQYAETGFKWLDRNIQWAKENGIRLVLNMHCPQGGYQSNGDGHALWTNPENTKRLSALWTEIAKRYADEPTILGFGLINEPGIPVEKSKDAMPIYTKAVQNIIDSIREVNQNHIIFVEKLGFIQDSVTLERDWVTLNNRCNWPEVQDNNLVYEFHTYNPFTFTHQSDSSNTVYYPDTSRIEKSVLGDTIKDVTGYEADWLSDGWQTLEVPSLVCTGENQIVRFFLENSYMGSNGRVYIDDIVVKEFDENGDFLRTVYTSSFPKKTTVYFWSETSNKLTGYSSNAGVDSSGCIWVGNIDKYGDGVSYSFKGTPNHSYSASVAVRVENVSRSLIVRPRLRLSSAKEVIVSDRNFLETSLKPEVNFSKKYNVPIYCGEFGANSNCFAENGGDIWVSDMLDIFKENGIHFNYHVFHEPLFGLYRNSINALPDDLNQDLYNVFAEKLKPEY